MERYGKALTKRKKQLTALRLCTWSGLGLGMGSVDGAEVVHLARIGGRDRGRVS